MESSSNEQQEEQTQKRQIRQIVQSQNQVPSQQVQQVQQGQSDELSQEKREELQQELRELLLYWENMQPEDESVTIRITKKDKERMSRIRELRRILMSPEDLLKQQQILEQRKLQEQHQQYQQPAYHQYQQQNVYTPQRQQYDQFLKFDDDSEIQEQVKIISNSQLAYDLSQNLTLQIRGEQDLIVLEESARKFSVMVSLEAKESLVNLDQRSNVDLICVIDVSGSMEIEQKLDLVKETLHQLLEHLNEKDRLCLIEFESFAKRLTPLLAMNPENKLRMKQIIDKLTTKGGTSIASGMRLALRTIEQRRFKNEVTSIFLLTDGQDQGADNQVSTLLHEYPRQDEVFSIRTFGFGSDHDSKLMDNIASFKDGSFYYIQKLPQVEEAFISALGSLMSVVAQNVELVLSQNDPDITISKTYGDFWQKLSANQYKISILQLVCGVSKDFLLEIELPSNNRKYTDQDRERSVITVQLSLESTTGEKIRVEKTQKLKLWNIEDHDPSQQASQDGEVLANYYRVKGAESLDEGMQLARQGKHQQAQMVVDNLMKQIEENKNVKKSQIQGIMNDLNNAKQSFQQDVYKEHGEHTLTNIRRAHMEQKGQILQEDNSELYQNTQTRFMIQKMKKAQLKREKMRQELESEGIIIESDQLQSVIEVSKEQAELSNSQQNDGFIQDNSAENDYNTQNFKKR